MKPIDFIKEILDANVKDDYKINISEQVIKENKKEVLMRKTKTLLYAVFVLDIKPMIIEKTYDKILSISLEYKNEFDFKNLFFDEFEDLFYRKVKLEEEVKNKLKDKMFEIMKSNPILINWLDRLKIELSFDDNVLEEFLKSVIEEVIRDIEEFEISLSFNTLRKNIKDIFEGDVISFVSDDNFIKDIYLKYVESRAHNLKVYYDIILNLIPDRKFVYYEEKKVKKKRGEEVVVTIGNLRIKSWVWGQIDIVLGENQTISDILKDRYKVFERLFDVDFEKISRERNKIIGNNDFTLNVISGIINNLRVIVSGFFRGIEDVRVSSDISFLENEDAVPIYDNLFDEIRRKLLIENIKNYVIKVYILTKDRLSSYVIIEENDDMIENLDRAGNIGEIYVFIRSDLDGVFFDLKNLEDFIRYILRLKNYHIEKMDVKDLIFKVFSKNNNVEKWKKTSIYLYMKGNKTYLGKRDAIYVEFADKDVNDVINDIKNRLEKEI